MQVFLWSAMYLDVLQPGSALQCLHSKKVFFVFEILSKACIYSDNRWKIIARKINLADGGQGAGDGWGAGSGWGSASSLNTYECCWITTSSFGKIPPYSFVIAFAFCLTVFFLYKPQYQAHQQEYQQNTTDLQRRCYCNCPILLKNRIFAMQIHFRCITVRQNKYFSYEVCDEFFFISNKTFTSQIFVVRMAIWR